MVRVKARTRLRPTARRRRSTIVGNGGAGVFATIMTDLAARAQQTELKMIDATHLKAHRPALSLAVKKGGALRTGDG